MKIDSNHINDSENIETLTKFCQIFGKYDAITGNGLQTVVDIQNNEKSEVSQKVKESIAKFVSFKQIGQDRSIVDLKAKIKQEELEKAEAEAAAAATAEEEVRSKEPSQLDV